MTGTLIAENTVEPSSKTTSASTSLVEDAATGLRNEYSAWDLKQKSERAAAKAKKHSSFYESICIMHHLCIVVAVCYVARLGYSHWPSIMLVAGWWVYSDLYSSLLHCVLDDERCLAIPGLSPVARGFQDHHKFPMETTAGKGLLRLCNDTVRIQWIIGGMSYLFSAKRNYFTFLLVLLKWLTCAYGTQIGHYYAHCAHRAPRFITWLQELHILLPPSIHWQHHKAPYDCHFGIVNGLSNHHINPAALRDKSFTLCVGLWFVLTVFDIVIIERLVGM